MSKAKKPTLKEKVKVYEDLFFRLNLHRTITMREPAVFEILRLIDGWVGAHGDHNGERSSADIDQNVCLAFERLKTLP